MDYVQMTLDEWVEMKQKLKEELLGVTQSFVRIGFALRQIDDQKLYERDGYKSVAEFAEKECGLNSTTTSRFMSINREYSVDGYSDRLRPEFAGLGRSQLEEMLKLPEEDRSMIQPETAREDIRNLKRFNKTEPPAGEADDIRELIRKFFEDNLGILSDLRKEGLPGADAGTLAEIVNPAGNRSYKKGLFFLVMYENRVAVKKFGRAPQDMTWEEFFRIAAEVTEDLEEPEEPKAEPEQPRAGRKKETPPAKEAKEKQEDLKKEDPAGQQAEGEEEPSGQQAKDGEAPAGQQKEGLETAETQKAAAVAPAQKTEVCEAPLTEEPEVVEKPFGTRKDYLDTLTEYGAADSIRISIEGRAAAQGSTGRRGKAV